MPPRKRATPNPKAGSADLTRQESTAYVVARPDGEPFEKRFSLVTDVPTRTYTVSRRKYDDHVQAAFVHAGEPGAIEIHDAESASVVTTIRKNYGDLRETLPNDDGSASTWKIRAWSVAEQRPKDADHPGEYTVRRYFIAAVPADAEEPADDES